MIPMSASLDTRTLATQESLPPPTGPSQDYPLRELSKGEPLYLSGDPAEAVFRLEEGLLKLSIDVPTGKERIVSLAGPGDYVGALAPSRALFQESAEALSHRVTVRIVPRKDLSNQLLEQVYAAAGEHLVRLQSALEDSGLQVGARLARTLLRLGDRFGHLSDQGVRLTLPLTHEDLATMIGAARETTTAALGEMRAQGLIQGTRGNYSFQREQLRDFATESSLNS